MLLHLDDFGTKRYAGNKIGIGDPFKRKEERNYEEANHSHHRGRGPSGDPVQPVCAGTPGRAEDRGRSRSGSDPAEKGCGDAWLRGGDVLQEC